MSHAQDADPRPGIAPGIGQVDYFAVLEASQNAIVAVGADGRITYANPRTLTTFGWEPAELLGRQVEVLLPERLADTHIKHRAGQTHHPGGRAMGVGFEVAARRKDGSEFPVEIGLSPVDTAEGTWVFATIVDITARKALEGQLLQAQKMESVGRLAGGIAHDFNNMLFAIRGYADLLIEDLEKDEPKASDLRPSVEAIQGAADRAASLTSQLLSFSRRQVLNTQVLDLNDIVTDIEPMVRRLIGENINFTTRLGPEAGRFRGDAGQVDQILINLIVNARDALVDGAGDITIETSRAVFDELYTQEHFAVTPGPYVMLAVSDTGVGMDAETRAHAFEPFFTTKKQGSGTGLGLATIYGIVHQAGGHIWLYSVPGRGTTFKIYFPQIDAALADVIPPIEPDITGQGRVLVVEDEPVVRALTVSILERGGYEAVAVDSADAGLPLIAGQKFDAIVSDVVMPGMSGSELAERVLSEHPEIGVVLVSGYTAEMLGVSALQARGAVFLSKPFSRGTLIAAVTRVIAAHDSVRTDISPGALASDRRDA